MSMSVHRGPFVEIDGATLGALMTERGLSLTRLANMIDSNCSTISRIIRRGTCRSEMLRDIAKALSVDKSELLLKLGRSELSAPEYYRLQAGMTREDLSEKSGISINSICRIERNEGDVFTFTAACLARACGVPIGVYLGYE